MLLGRQQPSRQAGAQVGVGGQPWGGGGGGGLCRAVRIVAKQLFAVHPDRVCS